MDSPTYREANILADVVDFYEGSTDERDIAVLEILKSDLAEQERIDGCPADLREERQGYLGAI